MATTITKEDLINDATDGYMLTTRMLAENSIARTMRHQTNFAVHKVATDHLSPEQAFKVRGLLAKLVARDAHGMLNNQTAMDTSTMQHQAALKIGMGGLVGGSVGGTAAVDPMQVATRTRVAMNQALITQRFTGSDFTNWMQTMAQIQAVGQNNPTFMADFALTVAPTGARLASISDDEVTVLAARQKFLAGRYGTDDIITLALEQ